MKIYRAKIGLRWKICFSSLLTRAVNIEQNTVALWGNGFIYQQPFGVGGGWCCPAPPTSPCLGATSENSVEYLCEYQDSNLGGWVRSVSYPLQFNSQLRCFHYRMVYQSNLSLYIVADQIKENKVGPKRWQVIKLIRQLLLV